MTYLLTLRGRELLCAKIGEIERKLKEVLSQKGDAYVDGGNGWHDNFSFEQLVREEATLATELSNQSSILLSATIVPSAPVELDAVSVGTIIELEDEDGNVHQYEVAGFGEGDMTTTPKKIEYLAPVIRPFIGGSLHDEHLVSFAGKQVTFTLINMRRP